MDGKELIKKYLPYYVFGGTIVVLGVIAFKNRKLIKKKIVDYKNKLKKKK